MCHILSTLFSTFSFCMLVFVFYFVIDHLLSIIMSQETLQIDLYVSSFVMLPPSYIDSFVLFLEMQKWR